MARAGFFYLHQQLTEVLKRQFKAMDRYMYLKSMRELNNEIMTAAKRVRILRHSNHLSV